MTDLGAAVLGAFCGLDMIGFGLLVARELRAVVGAVRDLVADLGEDVAEIKQSQARVERRLGLRVGDSLVDVTERHRRPPAAPPEY